MSKSKNRPTILSPDKQPADTINNGRTRSPSMPCFLESKITNNSNGFILLKAVGGFDGTSSWSPAKFRKSIAPNHDIFTPALEMLIQEISVKGVVTFEKLVGVKDFADIAFTIGSHIIYAHKVIVEARCRQLLSVAVKDRGKKGSILTYKIDEKLIDIRTLHVVLEYLYSGTIRFEEIFPSDIVPLLATAELYQIDRMVWLCERYIKAVLSNDNFFVLYKTASSSQNTRAKQLCLEFASQNFKKLIVNKEGVQSIGLELFREMVVYTSIPPETPIEDPESKSLSNTIAAEFQIIYSGMQNPDAFVTFKDESNTKLGFHKVIFYSNSEQLKAFFNPPPEDVASHIRPDGSYILPSKINMSSAAFKSLTAWMYYRSTNFNATHAAEMVRFARNFDIYQLVTECDAKIRKGISLDSVLHILSLCYGDYAKLGYKKDLQKPCLDFIVLNFANLDLKPLKHYSPSIIADIMEAIRNAVEVGSWISTSAPIVVPTDELTEVEHEDPTSTEDSVTKEVSSEASEQVQAPTPSRPGRPTVGRTTSEATDSAKKYKTYRRKHHNHDDDVISSSGSPKFVRSGRTAGVSTTAPVENSTSEHTPLTAEEVIQNLNTTSSSVIADAIEEAVAAPVSESHHKEQHKEQHEIIEEKSSSPQETQTNTENVEVKPVVEESPSQPQTETKQEEISEPISVQPEATSETTAPVEQVKTETEETAKKDEPKEVKHKHKKEKSQSSDGKGVPDGEMQRSPSSSSTSKSQSSSSVSKSNGKSDEVSEKRKSSRMSTPPISPNGDSTLKSSKSKSPSKDAPEEHVTLPEVKLRPTSTKSKDGESSREVKPPLVPADSKKDVKTIAATFEAHTKEETKKKDDSKSKKKK